MSNENLKGTLWEDSDNWDTYVPCCTDDKCECDDTKCDECGNFPPTLDYNDGAYCTWYCAKKESK